ncbi:MAG: type IV secretory system conjugative DNA transfer family protein [Oscillospiraceae bacterium]|nr:type IV secretory system conjugative DNA transfer family protein [Oscillospiraceae bacterium]
MKKILSLIWLEVRIQRPFEFEQILAVLTALAALTPRSAIVFEARGFRGRVRYYIGVDRQYLKKVMAVFKAYVRCEFSEVSKSDRLPVNEAKQLKITRPILSLRTELAESVARVGIFTLLQTRGNEQTVIQIIIGDSYNPAPAPRELPDPHASWLKVAFSNVKEASTESRNTIRDKLSHHRFAAAVRLGATGTRTTAPAHILNLLSALRTLTSAGVTIQTSGEKPEKIDTAHIPRHFPLRLSVKELGNLLLLPIGETELPGVAGLHPRELHPPAWYRSPENKANDRTFAVALDEKTRLSISPKDSLCHTLLMGPTGSGKSTAMLHLILADIKAGKSVLVIDPKYQLIHDVLARMPKERDDDVVIIDPSSKLSTVGFNPLAFKDTYAPGLVADAVLAVFKAVFKENWGVRTQDVLPAALLTLVQAKGSSLLWLPTLLTDETFRRKITVGINDKIGLEAYWSAFESLNDSAKRIEVAPILNKIRPFLLRPELRNILGQSDPKFNLTDLFNKPRILLVPLNKGFIGEESAKLLGSLIVGLTWTLALSRAGVSEEKLRHISVFVDELQDYLALPTDFSNALAQARGLKMSLTLAHQFRKQLTPEIKDAIDANVKAKIYFGLTSAVDAESVAAMAPELKAADFMKLPQYHVYTTFTQNGGNVGWASGKTLPPPKATRNPTELKEKVLARYGKSGAEVEQEYLEMLAKCRGLSPQNEPEGGFAPIGRRKKQ